MPPKRVSPATTSVPAAASARAASTQATTPKSRASQPAAASAAAQGAQSRVPARVSGTPAKAPANISKSIAAQSAGSNTLEEKQPEIRSPDETPEAAATPPAQTRSRARRASNASVRGEQTVPIGRTVKAAPASGGAAASRQHPRARQEIAQAVPARAGSSEQGAGRTLVAVLAQLESIGRGLGEVEQLRADVQLLSRRIDELAAAIAGQDWASAESAAPVAPERDPESRRASRKGRATRASLPAEPGGTSDGNNGGGGEENVAGRERDPGDAVPPGVAVQTPAPLRPGDEAVLHTLEELPRRVARPRGKVGGRSRK